MEAISTLISGMVIICLLGTMIYATNAIKAHKTNRHEEKKKNMTMAGIFFVGYLIFNVIRMFAER